MLQGPGEHGISGLVNLFGIESPGLTASLALADEALSRLALAEEALSRLALAEEALSRLAL